MKTTNGYNFTFKNNKCILKIPKTQGIFNNEVQKAKNEICTNNNLPYFSEIVIKKA